MNIWVVQVAEHILREPSFISYKKSCLGLFLFFSSLFPDQELHWHEIHHRLLCLFLIIRALILITSQHLFFPKRMVSLYSYQCHKALKCRLLKWEQADLISPLLGRRYQSPKAIGIKTEEIFGLEKQALEKKRQDLKVDWLASDRERLLLKDPGSRWRPRADSVFFWEPAKILLTAWSSD